MTNCNSKKTKFKLLDWFKRLRPTSHSVAKAIESNTPTIHPPTDLQEAAVTDYSAIPLSFLPPQEAYPVDLEEGEFLFIGEVPDGGAVVCGEDGMIYFFHNWRKQLPIGRSCAEAARAIAGMIR